MRPLALSAALALLAAPAARAQNLVANGGFEGGTYTGTPGYLPQPDGWTFAANGPGGGYAGVGGNAHTGSKAYIFENFAPGNSSTLSQTLATTAGTTYRIGFFAFDDVGGGAGAPDNRLTVTFGGRTVFDAMLTNTSYQEFAFEARATDASTVLAFTGSNLPRYTTLDDVSVTAVASTVPEPATWVTLGAGVLALGTAARRRRA